MISTSPVALILEHKRLSGEGETPALDEAIAAIRELQDRAKEAESIAGLHLRNAQRLARYNEDLKISLEEARGIYAALWDDLCPKCRLIEPRYRYMKVYAPLAPKRAELTPSENEAID